MLFKCTKIYSIIAEGRKGHRSIPDLNHVKLRPVSNIVLLLSLAGSTVVRLQYHLVSDIEILSCCLLQKSSTEPTDLTLIESRQLCLHIVTVC